MAACPDHEVADSWSLTQRFRSSGTCLEPEHLGGDEATSPLSSGSHLWLQGRISRGWGAVLKNCLCPKPHRRNSDLIGLGVPASVVLSQWSFPGLE